MMTSMVGILAESFACVGVNKACLDRQIVPLARLCGGSMLRRGRSWLVVNCAPGALLASADSYQKCDENSPSTSAAGPFNSTLHTKSYASP